MKKEELTYEERTELKEICKPMLDYLRTKFPDTNVKIEVDTAYDRINLYKLSSGISVFEPHSNY